MLDKIAAMKERDDATTQFRLTAARLRATNADLLAALDELINIVDGLIGDQICPHRIDSFTLDPARAAIAKARNQ